MKHSNRLRSRMCRVIFLALVAVLATAAVASAANPVKGAKYTGTINANGGLAISFKVTSNGKDVVKMQVPQPPIFCQGGGPPPTQNRAKPAPISSTGTFNEKLKYVSGTGSVIATLKVTGAFHAHHKESGKVTVSWSAASCNGSALYSTKVA